MPPSTDSSRASQPDTAYVHGRRDGRGRRYTSADRLRATPSSSFSLFLGVDRPWQISRNPSQPISGRTASIFQPWIYCNPGKSGRCLPFITLNGNPKSGSGLRNPKNRHFFPLQLSIKSSTRQTPKSESDKSPQLTAAAALTSQCDKWLSKKGRRDRTAKT